MRRPSGNRINTCENMKYFLNTHIRTNVNCVLHVGEVAAGSIVIAGGTDWEMKLHLFMSKGAKKDDEPAPFTDTFPTGHPEKKPYVCSSLLE